MRVVLAPDSFKESMTAHEAALAMERGIRDVLPRADCVLTPMSDGGEGFVEAVMSSWRAEPVPVETVDALGRPLTAVYGLAGDRAVMDVASCAGLEHVAAPDRDVMRSNTAGLGYLLIDAARRGARRIVLGIGGSATNDAGVGMLHALGVRFSDARGLPVPPLPEAFERIVSIDTDGLSPLLRDVVIEVACDVTNPLTGPSGATAVFGPQKGVTPQQVNRLDRSLGRLADLSGRGDLSLLPGAGAAGGLGFALRAFLGARTSPGVDVVARAVGLADLVADADLLLTGEGHLDAQTVAGKTPAGVAGIAARAGVECIALAGRVSPGAEVLLEAGVTRIVRITPDDQPLETALRRGPHNMRRAVRELFTELAGPTEPAEPAGPAGSIGITRS